MAHFRLLRHGPASGEWNMAVDEALLTSARRSGAACLRFYEWAPATLSLGYFQSAAARGAHPASLECPLVRRVTGGGAILHHLELTYSFTTPIGDRLRAEHQGWYRVFHEALVAALRSLGILARVCEADARHASGAEPFLCFQRHTAGDVLIGEHKVAGSAQRRFQGALLQHGSVLLRVSPQAPELPGICDLGTLSLTANELQELWLRFLPSEWRAAGEPGELSDTEQAEAAEWQRRKFGHSSWNNKR